MAELPQFSNYNEATARSLIESNNRNMGGLPGFIGMELVEFDRARCGPRSRCARNC